jgi:N-methylhydantoinase A
MIRIAFDIGGTFTDFVLEDDRSGTLQFWKVPTTTSDLAKAVLQGLDDLLCQAGVAPEAVEGILHATTVATNAITERKGSRTALLTTEGFRDVLIIGRQKRYETYDLYLDKPAPLVRRRDIFELPERVNHDGTVERPLDPATVDCLLDEILRRGYESVAVSLLHAYAEPAHERLVGECIAARGPELAVSLSSDISPKLREYERTNTTVANAYIKPIIGRYLANLSKALKERGVRSELFIMQSNGGLVSPELARAYPIRIVESGPAAGVLLCSVIGRREGFDQVITFDMGGTTAKLGAIDGGEPAIIPTFEINQVRYRKGSGLPLNISAIELLEIGAGGGSIAATDMGLIKIGPESAGAEPGPICYGRGGTRPTVTDASLVLGYINPDYFNGGAMKLDREAAAAGIRRHLGDELGLKAGEAAWGIYTMANANMEQAMRIVSVERGRDPRRFALVAFGGAGPLHASRLAHALDIPTVIIPYGAGVGSAIGLLEANSKIDTSVTRVMAVEDAATAAIACIYDELEQRARTDLKRLGTTEAPNWARFAYMRYAGQGYEIRVDLPAGPINGDYAARARVEFHRAYERNYGYCNTGAAVEAVDWYLVATVPNMTGCTERKRSQPSTRGGESRRGTRQAYFPELGGYVDCAVVDRYAMALGEVIEGPAIIEERESTTVLLPDDRASTSALGNLVITTGGSA